MVRTSTDAVLYVFRISYHTIAGSTTTYSSVKITILSGPTPNERSVAKNHPTKMVIVNPYLKKKQKPAPSLSAGAGRENRSLSSRHITGSKSGNSGPNSVIRRPITSSGSNSDSVRNALHTQPSRITPNGKKTRIANGSNSASIRNGLHAQPSRVTPNGKKPMTTTASRENVANKRHASLPKRSSKSKLSVKQRLKQEIAALKKQKQLQKLQKEADERRRRRMAEKKAEEDRRIAFIAAKEKEKQQKQAERERLAAIKQEEKIRKQQERERKQREKEQERERKKEEKLRKEEEKRVLLEQKIEERRQKAEEKYRRELQAWKKHQQCWIEQQQRIHFMQQAHQQRQQQQYQQSQFNNHIANLQQTHSSPHNQQQLQNGLPFTRPSPPSPQSPVQLPLNQANSNSEQISSDSAATTGATLLKTPSPLSSPLDSSTALSIDSLMKSELISPTRLANTDGMKASEKDSIQLEVEPSTTAATADLCINNESSVVSAVDQKLPEPVKSKDSLLCGKNSAPTNVDKTGPSSNVSPPASNDTDNMRTGAKNVGSNQPVRLPATPSTEVALGTSPAVCANVMSASLEHDKRLSLQPALAQPSLMTLSQKKVSPQHSRPLVPPPINNQYLLQSSMGYGSMFPNLSLSSQAVATTSHLRPMISGAFSNFGNFGVPGYFSWVPPPPPPPLPPMLWQPKAARRVSSVPKRSKAPKQTAPLLLCNPMEAPSPFANQGRYLVAVMVIRDPRTETSFGVNLQLHTESALVDPQWLEAQKMKEGMKSKVNIKQDISAKLETKISSNNNGTNAVARLGDTQSTMPSSAPAASQRPVTSNYESSLRASEETLTTKGGVEGTEVEIGGSMRKVNLANPTNNLSSTSINKIIDDPRTNDSVKLNSDDSIKEVVRNCLDDLVSSIANNTQNAIEKSPSSKATIVPAVQKRKRRRRVNFAAMQVMDANKQNARRPDIDPEKKLQPGDIVVAIQGCQLNGMTFRDACGVFSKRAESVNDSLIQTHVIVMRKKANVVPVKEENAGNTNPVPTVSMVTPSPVISTETPSPSNPPTVAPSPPDNTSMVFSSAEIATMSHCFFQTLHSSSRVLGLDIQDSAWHIHSVIFRMGPLLKDTEVTPRTSMTLKNKWSHLTRFIDYNLVEKGKTFWTQKFSEEFGDEKVPFSSDVERRALRHLPRPSKGCRCKQHDHEYLFDPKCTLYRDVQRRLSKEELSNLRQRKKKLSMSKKDLNVVESAFKNRMLKLKTETENESIEARFVEKMEEIQVKELHEAIFAPNLTTIVLSAIFELQREFYVSIEEDEKENDNAEDDDDDVALDCLGKRNLEDRTENDAKKQHKIGREGDPNFSLRYLVRMLEYVSKTWGHCYREPERDEYAWRWELFHAVHSDFDQWDAHASNPRVSGSFPFENVRFGLSRSKSVLDEVSSLQTKIRQFEDSIISNSHSGLEFSNEILDQFCLVIHLLSPARSGLYDEMIALLKMGIFKVSSSGIPVLTEDWWAKIDIVVLDEMNSSWSTKVDPHSRYCVNDELRDTLEEKWVKSDYGWSLLENPKELIFDFGILDEWRETFEGRLEEKANHSDGIGRFGL